MSQVHPTRSCMRVLLKFTELSWPYGILVWNLESYSACLVNRFLGFNVSVVCCICSNDHSGWCFGWIQEWHHPTESRIIVQRLVNVLYQALQCCIVLHMLLFRISHCTLPESLIDVLTTSFSVAIAGNNYYKNPKPWLKSNGTSDFLTTQAPSITTLATNASSEENRSSDRAMASSLILICCTAWGEVSFPFLTPSLPGWWINEEHCLCVWHNWEQSDGR